jgi:hypothetical protein
VQRLLAKLDIGIVSDVMSLFHPVDSPERRSGFTHLLKEGFGSALGRNGGDSELDCGCFGLVSRALD